MRPYNDKFFKHKYILIPQNSGANKKQTLEEKNSRIVGKRRETFAHGFFVYFKRSKLSWAFDLRLLISFNQHTFFHQQHDVNEGKQ